MILKNLIKNHFNINRIYINYINKSYFSLISRGTGHYSPKIHFLGKNRHLTKDTNNNNNNNNNKIEKEIKYANYDALFGRPIITMEEMEAIETGGANYF